MALLLGRYEYLRELGAGSTGRVLLVRDRAAGDVQRAIKVVPAEAASLLRWEFARLRTVEHARLARVHELVRLDAPAHVLGLAGGSVLLVEEFVDGQVLGAFVRGLEGEVRERALLRAALGVCEALAAVHDAGLVHGDVKPDNVLVEASGEARLIDFGFARPPQLGAAPRGTPRTMAPELYAGVLGHAADVYALGASLYDLLGGAGSSGGLLRRFPALPDVSAPCMALVTQLVSADPAERPADGREALAALLVVAKQQKLDLPGHAHSYALTAPARAPDAIARRARALPFVASGATLERLASALHGQDVVVLRGPVGAGRTRLAREALRRCHEAWLSEEQAGFTWVEGLAALARVSAERVLVLLDPASAEELAEARRTVTAFRLSGRVLRVLAVGAADDPHVEPDALAMEPMDDAALRTLALRALDRTTLSHGQLSALRAASGGWPGRLCEALAEALAAGRDVDDVRAFAAPSRAPLALSAPARLLASAAAWLPSLLASPGAAAPLFASPGELAAAFDELLARAVLTRRAGQLEVAAGLVRVLRDESRARRASLAALAGDSTSGHALWLRGEPERAHGAWLREAQELRRSQRTSEARDLLEEARGLADDPSLALELADLARAEARYQEALQALAGLPGDEACLARAELQRLSGRPDEALSALQGLARPDHQRGAALRARLAFDGGQLAEARRCADALADADDLEARVRAREVRVLVGLAGGELAQPLAEALVEAALLHGGVRVLGRALSLRGQVLSSTGQQARALADARRALELARTAGELLESATFALNLGLLEFEAGELGQALSALDEAAYRLTLADRPRDLVRVLYNLGNVALFVGDLGRAEVVLAEAALRSSDGSDPAALTLTRVARAELGLGRGLLDEAQRTLELALAELPEGRPALRALVLSRTALVQLARDALAEAAGSVQLAEAEPLGDDVVTAAEVAIASARTRLALGAAAEAELRAQTALAQLGERLPVPERLRLLVAGADSARAAGQESVAATRLVLARALLERALSGLSPRLRASMRALSVHARVLESSTRERLGDLVASPERFRTLLRKSRWLFAEQGRARLYARAAELLLELVHAERALVVMAREDDASLRVLGQADLSAAPVAGKSAVFSRSVVERTLSEQQPVVTVEAGSDERFDAAHSLHTLSVRSVLCVPVPGLRGVLYLDDRVRGSAFSSEDVALAEDLALLVAQALSALVARREQARRVRRVEEEKDSLAGELQKMARHAPSSVALVYGSAVMTSFVELARRVASSDVPVLLRGESGTGKELVVRMIHEASPRRAGPFVAESCAALPDSLLESALFGHVRGAFTGADRARKGLFEQADGGTLLLDELGEMSVSLQAKLLRVLQEGEVRPVGSERTRRVDVRLVSATHRDLEQRVREGSFREDLYYRVAVVALDVPPLRARREDIALLTAHFVQKHGQGRRITVSTEVLRAFEAAAWPGNVRELENQVRRALALCRDRIELAHVMAPAALLRTPDTLDLHAQTDKLTRSLVEQALERAGGNLSQAAELLGISRFGLQKMVKRFGLGPYVSRVRK